MIPRITNSLILRDYSYRLKELFCLVLLINIFQVDSKTTPENLADEVQNEDGLTNQERFTECTKVKRVEDCLPVLYSTAILAVVTTFVLSLCGAFICCMVCCAARWRSRDLRQRLQLTGYALVSSNRSSELTEVTSPTESLHFCPSRHNPDPPPKYPGPIILSDRLSTGEDAPPPPYTPSFSKTDANFQNH